MPRTRSVGTQCAARLKLPVNIREVALTRLFGRNRCNYSPLTCLVLPFWLHYEAVYSLILFGVADV